MPSPAAAKPRTQIPVSAIGHGHIGQSQIRDRSGRISEYSVRLQLSLLIRTVVRRQMPHLQDGQVPFTTLALDGKPMLP